jgi:hypothetical protein
MARIDANARIIIKQSTVSGETASLAPLSVNGTYDHTLLPSWNPSDIYIGEFFMNEPDEKLWIRLNSTTIKRILLEGDVVSSSGGTPGTSGTSGTSGINGTSGTSGINGTITGVTIHNDFYYNSGNTTLYVPKIVTSEMFLTGLTSSGLTNYLVSDNNGKLFKTNVNVNTTDVIIGAVTLHFVNGLFTGCDGC